MLGKREARDGQIKLADGFEGTGRVGDSQFPIDLLGGTAVDGTWTKAVTATGLPTVARTSANDTVEEFVVPITALGGAMVKPISVKVVYTADLNDAGDDVQFHLQTIVAPANGVAQASAVVLAGDADADYDSDHNTAAKRVLETATPELHTAVVTIPAGEQAFQAADKQLQLMVKVTEADDATAALAIIVQQAILTARVRIL